jgi:hypothetical protein
VHGGNNQKSAGCIVLIELHLSKLSRILRLLYIDQKFSFLFPPFLWGKGDRNSCSVNSRTERKMTDINFMANKEAAWFKSQFVLYVSL